MLEGLHQLADDVIHLENEIAVRTGLGFALECLAGKGRQMHGLHGVKQEKGFVGIFLGVAREEFLAFLEEDQVDLLEIEIRGDHAGAVITGVRMLGQWPAIHNTRGRDRDLVVINISVKPIGGGARSRAEEFLKAVIQRPAGDRPRVIDAPHGRQSVLIDGFPILVVRRQPNVPFAEHRRGVALLLQQTGECEASRVDQARPAHAGENAAVIQPKRHPAGKQAVARGCANGGGTVRVGEANAFARKPIQVRRGHFALVVVTTDIAVAEVIGEDEEDIRLVGGL